jgi:uncharacterized membrane protein
LPAQPPVDPKAHADPDQKMGPLSGSKSYPTDAKSGWFLCNQSDEEALFAATRTFSGDGWLTTGWYRIDKGACQEVESKILFPEAYYFAAGQAQSFGGNAVFCVDPQGEFSDLGDDCPEGYEKLGFRRVELGNSLTYTNIR